MFDTSLRLSISAGHSLTRSDVRRVWSASEPPDCIRGRLHCSSTVVSTGLAERQHALQSHASLRQGDLSWSSGFLGDDFAQSAVNVVTCLCTLCRCMARRWVAWPSVPQSPPRTAMALPQSPTPRTTPTPSSQRLLSTPRRMPPRSVSLAGPADCCILTLLCQAIHFSNGTLHTALRRTGSTCAACSLSHSSPLLGNDRCSHRREVLPASGDCSPLLTIMLPRKEHQTANALQQHLSP